MAVTSHVYTKAHNSLASKLMNLTGDTLKVMLMSSYNVGTTQDTAQFMYDLTGFRWTSGTTYTMGQLAQPTVPNGHIYQVTTPGTAGATEPTWPTTTGASVTGSGGIVWTEAGAPIASEAVGQNYTAGGQTLSSVLVQNSGHTVTITCANPTWSNSSVTATHAVFYDASGSSYATDPLLCFWDFGGAQQSLGGTFLLTISGTGLVTMTGS